MKHYARNLDTLGRICIPREILRINNIKEGSLLSIRVTSDGILLSPVDASCVICGKHEDLLTVDDITICRGCAEIVRERIG